MSQADIECFVDDLKSDPDLPKGVRESTGNLSAVVGAAIVISTT